MRWMLGRIMALNLLSLYTLIFALFDKTDEMIHALEKIENMTKAGVDFGLDLTTASPPIRKDCFTVPIPCELLNREDASLPAVLSLFYEFEEERGNNGFNSSGDFFFEGESFNISSKDLYNSSSPNFTMTEATSSPAFTTAATTRTSSITSAISTKKAPNDNENSTSTLRAPVTNVIDLWLRNITRKKVSSEVEDDCKSCLERCGEECLDLCNLVHGCGAKDTGGMVNGDSAQMPLKSKCNIYLDPVSTQPRTHLFDQALHIMIHPLLEATNMTSLILLLRKTANMTGLFRREGQQTMEEEPFDHCHSCARDVSFEGSNDYDDASENQGVRCSSRQNLYKISTII